MSGHAIPSMDNSSLVTAQPSFAPNRRSSSLQRWSAIFGATVLFVACAALVSALGGPHQQLSLASNLMPSFVETAAPADSRIASSSLPQSVLFTTLQSDPIDSVLKKAMLPTISDIKSVMKCVEPLAAGFKTLAAGPSASKVTSVFATMDKCAGRLSSLADQCESSPSLMALATVPNVGGLVSFVCGQAAALVEKYEFFKTNLMLGRQITKLAVASKNKGGGDSDPISFSKVLEKAGLPSLSDLSKIIKCVPSVSKGIAKLAGNSNIAAVKSALSNLDKCVSELADLADACEGPAVMAISMVPNVGSVVGFVCAQAANMVAKFRSVQDRVASGLSIVNSVSTAAVNVRFPQLKFSIGGAVKQVAKTADKAGDAVAKTATSTAATVAKVADKAATAVVKTATTVGKVLASLGDPINMALEQAGLPTLKELTKCVECTLPVAKGLKKLAGKPSKATVASVLDSLKSCMKKLEDVASKCEGPAVMAISSVPTIGQVVAVACAMASSMVEKYSFFTDLISRGISVGVAIESASSTSKSSTAPTAASAPKTPAASGSAKSSSIVSSSNSPASSKASAAPASQNSASGSTKKAASSKASAAPASQNSASGSTKKASAASSKAPSVFPISPSSNADGNDADDDGDDDISNDDGEVDQSIIDKLTAKYSA